MADTPNYAAASASTPWFAQQQVSGTPTGAAAQGNSITTERGILNQQVNGVAGDLSDQTTALVAALDAIAAAINAKPSA